MSFYRAHRIPAGIVAPLNDLLLLGIILQVGLSANFCEKKHPSNEFQITVSSPNMIT